MADVDLLTARSARLRDARQLTIGKYRRLRDQFLAEGPQAVREALAAGAALEVFIEESVREKQARELRAAQSAGLPVHLVEAPAFAGLVSTQTPQGIVAVCTWAPGALSDLVATTANAPDARSGQVVLAHEMSDPGNAGAVIRVADAVGAFGVAMSSRSVDPTNPKCVRASVGSLFHLPVVPAGDTVEAISDLRGAGFRILAADITSESVDLFAAERDGLLSGRVAWVFGNESHGLPDSVLHAADHVVRIPILGGAESLNLATAAAICMYAHARLGAGSGQGALPNP